MVRDSFEFGSVTNTLNKKYNIESWRYCVYSLGELKKIMNLFNGKLKTKAKKEQFRSWITLHKRLNCDFSVGMDEIQHKPFDEGWLIGFSEGEGSFTYSHSEGWPSFNITQNNKEILEKIRDYFGLGCVYKHCGRKDCKAWKYKSPHNLDDLEIIKNFFQGRLKTKNKQEQFGFWSQLFDPDHPLRVKGREYTRLRYKKLYAENSERYINAVKKWKSKNRDKVNEYKRKSYHRRKELEKT